MYTILDAYIIFLYTDNTSMYTQYYIISIYIHIHIVCIYMYMYILDTCKCTHIYICTYVIFVYTNCIYIYIYICTPAFNTLYIYIYYAHIYIYIYCWIYIYIYVFYVTHANRTLAFQTCQNLLHLGFTAIGHGCRCDHRSDVNLNAPLAYICM